jgi:peptidoglycan/LPS O-acetylase OafA/YrhL
VRHGNSPYKEVSAQCANLHLVAQRDRLFDLVKGLSITEVVIHHSSSAAMRLTEKGDAHWWVMAVLNRVLHFAVPTFLLVSAILLTRSLAKEKPNRRRYWLRRAQRTLWPFLLWAGAYLAYRAWLGRIEYAQLAQAGTWYRWLVLGKAYYHLYFMTVLLQLAVLLPVGIWLMRRFRGGFRSAMALAFGVQFVLYAINYGIRFEAPASTIFWYAPSMIVGIWLGLRWPQGEDALRRACPLLIVLALAGGGAYLSQALPTFFVSSVQNQVYHFGMWVYTTSVALLLMVLARAIDRRDGWVRRLFDALGGHSLPIYLIHPVVLVWLMNKGALIGITGTPLRFVYLAVGALAISYGVAWLIGWAKLSPTLMGRPAPPGVSPSCAPRLGAAPASQATNR